MDKKSHLINNLKNRKIKETTSKKIELKKNKETSKIESSNMKKIETKKQIITKENKMNNLSGDKNLNNKSLPNKKKSVKIKDDKVKRIEKNTPKIKDDKVKRTEKNSPKIQDDKRTNLKVPEIKKTNDNKIVNDDSKKLITKNESKLAPSTTQNKAESKIVQNVMRLNNVISDKKKENIKKEEIQEKFTDIKVIQSKMRLQAKNNRLENKFTVENKPKLENNLSNIKEITILKAKKPIEIVFAGIYFGLLLTMIILCVCITQSKKGNGGIDRSLLYENIDNLGLTNNNNVI
jgi:hypothetical protein